MELSMEEGRVQKWLVTEGLFIKKGEIIAEIETDKAVVELEMPQDGMIRKFLVKEGELAPVGAELAELQTGSVKAEEAGSSPIISLDVAESKPRISISPAARRKARELGVDYTQLVGSGPRGRIVYRDLELAAGVATGAAVQKISDPIGKIEQLVTVTQSTTKAVISGNSVVVPLSKMRRTIARRLLESVNTIPQFSLKRTVEVSKLLAVKQAIQGSAVRAGIKLTFTDFLISAVAQALGAHPALNASFVGSPLDEDCYILQHEAVNIGLAVSTETGLVVPVLHNADKLTIPQIAKLRMTKVDNVRKNTLKSDDLQGGSFTISNLGMFNVDEFQAIINPPEAGILAVGSIRQAPLLIEGKLEFRPVITLSGTFDHRVVDGAAAAAFMHSLAEQMESDEWSLM